jgi:hypothetical protein
MISAIGNAPLVTKKREEQTTSDGDLQDHRALCAEVTDEPHGVPAQEAAGHHQ